MQSGIFDRRSRYGQIFANTRAKKCANLPTGGYCLAQKSTLACRRVNADSFKKGQKKMPPTVLVLVVILAAATPRTNLFAVPVAKLKTG